MCGVHSGRMHKFFNINGIGDYGFDVIMDKMIPIFRELLNIVNV
jgi:hypothetical protein